MIVSTIELIEESSPKNAVIKEETKSEPGIKIY